MFLSRISRKGGNIRDVPKRLLSAYDLFLGMGEVTFKTNSIFITGYPFKPSQIYPNKAIDFASIKEIHCSPLYCPPTILLKDKEELIFIEAEHANRLLEFATYHNIEMPDRNTNWDLITEPFLDQEPTATEIERTIRALLSNGFSLEEIRQLRSQVESQMKIYNFDTMLMEYSGFSLHDVLCAMSGAFENPSDYESFYWRAMEIETRKRGSLNFDEKTEKFLAANKK